MSRLKKRQLQRRREPQISHGSGRAKDALPVHTPLGEDDGGPLDGEGMTPDQIRQSLARHGHLDEDAPWDAFVKLVIGAAVGAGGKRIGVLIKAGTSIEERLILPDALLGNLKSFKSWLNENGFPALVDVATDKSLEHLAREVFNAAREIHIVLEREGITQVKGSGALIACYGGELYAPAGLEEKLAAPTIASEAAGSVDSWNKAVAPYLLRAPVLLFTIGLALTPAMFWRTGECLAFELVGPPGSIDERIAAQVAASVGDGADDPAPWTNVKPALARLQQAGRCRILTLDDIGDDDRRVIAEACGQQQFAMGTAADRSASSAVLVVGTAWRTAGMRLGRANWRSSHELGLTGIPTPRAGSLSGFFDETPNADARIELTRAVETNYGRLLPDLLRKVVREQSTIGDLFDRLQRETYGRLFRGATQPLSGIERRVADRFAIVGATLEVAISYSVLKLATGEGMECAAVLFDKWLQNWRVRDGNIYRAAAQHVQQTLRGLASGFPRFNDNCKALPIGFRGEHQNEDLVWVCPESFKALCGDYERATCLEALDHYGALKKSGKGLQFRKRLPAALVDSIGDPKLDPVHSFYAIRANFLESALG